MERVKVVLLYITVVEVLASSTSMHSSISISMHDVSVSILCYIIL